MQELLVDLYLRLCGLFRFVMIGTSSSDGSEDDNVLKLVSGAWARISEESKWVEWSDGDLGLIDLRWQRFAVRISSSGPEDPSASVWRFGAFLRFGGLLLDIIGVLSEDSVELADRIMFFRVLGSFGLAIDMTESEDSVREDNMMFDLVLGSFGVAIGRSESDDSDGEETMMFVLDLGSFGVAMGRSESDDSDGEDNMMFDLVLGNFGVAFPLRAVIQGLKRLKAPDLFIKLLQSIPTRTSRPEEAWHRAPSSPQRSGTYTTTPCSAQSTTSQRALPSRQGTRIRSQPHASLPPRSRTTCTTSRQPTPTSRNS